MKPAPHDHELIRAYYSGSATPQQVQDLESWLREDASHVRLFVDLALLDGLMLSEQKNQDAAAILTILGESEANAQPVLVEVDQSTPGVTKSSADGGLSLRDLAGASHYVVGKALRSKAVAIASIAAVLLIGVVLYIALSAQDGAPASKDIADQTPADPSGQDAKAVATLTATHNAQWGGPASAGLAPGDTLHAGQTLTLNTGFAEITTNDGAVAILEAPATIELLDNSNALRLHTGKLVGICETPSSKGFLVRTPHMDVTDLGTRFGIDASSPNATQAYVFQGSVDVAPSNLPDGQPMSERLVTGQAVRADADSPGLAPIDFESKQFAAIKPIVIPLRGTGVDQGVDEADPDWVIVTYDDEPLAKPMPLVVSTEFGHVRDLPNEPAVSQWVALLRKKSEIGGQPAASLLRTTIQIPQTIDSENVSLRMKYAVDNQLRAVIVNGHRIEVASGEIETRFRLKTLIISEHLVPGENKIEFEVINANAGSSVGIRMQWALHTTESVFDSETP